MTQKSEIHACETCIQICSGLMSGTTEVYHFLMSSLPLHFWWKTLLRALSLYDNIIRDTCARFLQVVSHPRLNGWMTFLHLFASVLHPSLLLNLPKDDKYCRPFTLHNDRSAPARFCTAKPAGINELVLLRLKIWKGYFRKWFRKCLRGRERKEQIRHRQNNRHTHTWEVSNTKSPTVCSVINNWRQGQGNKLWRKGNLSAQCQESSYRQLRCITIMCFKK